MAFIRLRNVSVEFPIYQGGSRSLKKAILAASSQRNIARDAFDRITVQALKGLTLDIEDGSRIALIGGNGAGKSTLLKVLAGIFEPTQGRLFSDGRISALLDANVGLDPYSTGRENIVLRGMYLGIHPRAMREHIDAIADFTELGQYIDMPVRTYSSGMMVRLAFAVSTCVSSEILLMDEWLAAGDGYFLAKAQKRMVEFVRGANIMVLASHSVQLLEEWCTEAILLEQGQIVAKGPIAEVLAEYHEREKRHEEAVKKAHAGS